MNTFEEIVKILKEYNLKISCAESCTGGLFVSSIVAVPDASSVLQASFVTYSEQSKVKFVNVCEDTLLKYGVVSENVAVEMAKGVCDTAECDVGVAITGYAGPASCDEDKTVGTVCFGFCINGITVSSEKHFGDVGRNVVRELSCVYAADTLLKLLKKFGDKK